MYSTVASYPRGGQWACSIVRVGGVVKTRFFASDIGSRSRSLCGVSEPESLFEVRAVMTLLRFPRLLEGSSSGRCRSTSTEESFPKKSAWEWDFRLAAT